MKTFNDLLKVNEQNRIEHCEVHGDFESKNVFGAVWTKCPFCSAEAKARHEREEMERDAAMKLRDWERRLGECGIPERFKNRTLENYKVTNSGQRSALDFAKQYLEAIKKPQTGTSAILCGKPGTGKTHLSVAIGIEAMKAGKMVLFTTVQRAVRRVKDSWRKESQESESEAIALLTEPDLLILDEIGVQFGSDFEKNLLFDILNERYEKNKPTLLLSNLTVSEVKAFLGERVYDRLREDGGRCIPFDWASHRAQMQ